MPDITESQQLWIHLYAVLVANSILIYDHIATLPEEIAFIWRRPKALSSKLFLVNRYIALLGNIFALCIDFLPMSDEAGTFGHFSSNATIYPGVGCYETYTAAIAARVGLAWCTEFAKLEACCGCLCLPGATSVNIVFHDGAMYFGAMTLINIPNILTYYSGSVNTRGSLATFTSSMSATLISRLVLNLHESMDTGILSTTVRDSNDFLTTRVNVQSAISSHHW
ncbi:uncharacterized protein F5891DRAFT_1186419 [Suillus fuscotomentosus]|uniref:DUF6533 domain-containing protein n=1 Tax=Suillus fuscotomentosus TaxID=1912939 RepID=A0AAD4HMQ9_9AGAM|nr:uncharacterized protein F5891DRAFT_1186419 [Suillus fuscotomentosus]KAG1902323.1 hypothetical protein F5891DRAFT_1186419 [Suillus fuscotomentosus]